jgi:hypothetical protein
MRTDLVIPQGADWGFAWPVRDATGGELDLTGWSARAQWRPGYEADPVFTWSSENGSITLADSTVTLWLRPADSDGWTAFKGIYDVELTSADGRVTRIAWGEVRVRRQVTR